jgi:hypothetical protein
MRQVKATLNFPADLIDDIDRYCELRGITTRTEAIRRSMKLLVRLSRFLGEEDELIIRKPDGREKTFLIDI